MHPLKTTMSVASRVRPHRLGVKGLVAVGAAATVLTAGGAALATVVPRNSPIDGSGVIHGCYTIRALNGSHVFRLQDAGSSCPKGTTAISWNQTGPAGPAGPAGQTGPAGPQGPAGQQGPAGTNGTNGASVLTSSGVPSGACSTGDSDIDLANGEVYTCTASAWTDTGNSIQGPAGPTGPAGPAGPSSLAALRGSPCTVGGKASTLSVSVDPTTGAVSMTCTPWVTVSVTVTGGAMSFIDIFDDTATTGTTCRDATSCSFTVPNGHSIRVDLQSGNDSPPIMGSPYTYTCPGSGAQSAQWDRVDDYDGDCPTASHDTPVTADYNVTASF